VKGNPNANDAARKAADETARDYKCGKDKAGAANDSGRAIELALRPLIKMAGRAGR
jgi:hypothetical protein